MHTVRNRLASRPPVAMPIAAGGKGPNQTVMRQDMTYVQRGSMAVPLTIPDESGLIEGRGKKRRNPKGKKARKAAARLAAAREAEKLATAAICDGTEPPRPAKPAEKKTKAKTRPRPAAARQGAVQPEQLPAIPAAPLLEQRLAERSAPVLLLPQRPEPLVVEAPEPAARVEAPQALRLLPAPEPLVEAPALPEETETAPEPEPATALAELADAPLPRARALVPARRQGLVDVIAFLLRDSGRRLARWSARRHKTREERAALRTAEARQINLQRELEALDALRRNRG